MNLLSYKDALIQSSNSKRKLLLGNGFSIACRSDIFRYDTLYEQASPSFNSNIKNAFSSLNTKDFELVMKALKNASLLVEVYNPANTTLIKKLKEDADTLKTILVQTIAKTHPERPSDITIDEYRTCRYFLKDFECIYTLNYDLLLYWTLMSSDENSLEDFKLVCDDGCRTPDSGKEDYVTWSIENTNSQNVHYLHGALHLFDAGTELKKYTWINTGVKLIDQIRNALDKDVYPLFVSEGTADEKEEKINHSSYLSRGLRSIANIGGSLFIYGHSLAENDNHILDLIPKSNVETLYVSIYGDPASVSNSNIIFKANNMAVSRQNLILKKKKKKPLNLEFFDAATAKIWR